MLHNNDCQMVHACHCALQRLHLWYVFAETLIILTGMHLLMLLSYNWVLLVFICSRHLAAGQSPAYRTQWVSCNLPAHLPYCTYWQIRDSDGCVDLDRWFAVHLVHLVVNLEGRSRTKSLPSIETTSKIYVKDFVIITNCVFILTAYAVMVVDIPSSGKAFHPLLINCSSTATVQLQTVDEHVDLPASELHNCSGLFSCNFKLDMSPA